MRKPWFGAKTYGLGLEPKSLAGWAATGVYVAAMTGASILIETSTRHLWLLLIVLGALTAAFVGMALATSDRQPWRWRWGGR